ATPADAATISLHAQLPIYWGDTSSSAGTVSYSGGIYTVSGTHTYGEEGSYSITIDVSDDGGSTTTITGTATVGDAALTGSDTAVARGTPRLTPRRLSARGA